MTWNIDVFNMPSGTNNAHFHVGGPGVAGPTVVNIRVPAEISNDFNLSGSATAANLNVRADQGIRSWDDFMQSLLGGQMYLNIHSAVNAGGEIRGQVISVPAERSRVVEFRSGVGAHHSERPGVACPRGVGPIFSRCDACRVSAALAEPRCRAAAIDAGRRRSATIHASDVRSAELRQ